MKWRYWYEIKGANLLTLPDSDAKRIVDRYKLLLNSLRKPIVIIAKKSYGSIKWQDTIFNVVSYRFYLGSNEKLDVFLERTGLDYESVEAPKDLFPVDVKVKSTYMVYNNMFYKVAVAYRLPKRIVEGDILQVLDIVDEVRLLVEPIERFKAYRWVKRKRKTVCALATLEQEDMELQQRCEIFQQLLEELTRRETMLFRILMVFVVLGETPRELKERFLEAKRNLEALGYIVDSPRCFQWSMYSLTLDFRLITETHTLGALFPFVTSSIVEEGGVFLGQSLIDGTAIIMNPFTHRNPHVLLLGTSGSGKSTTAKALLYRMYIKYYGDLDFYIVDPEGEYKRLGQQLKAQVIEVKPGQPLGLDPLKLLDPATAADFLVSAASIPGELTGELRANVVKHKSIWDLYRSASSELKRYLRGLLEGPDAYIFKGSPIEVGTRVVIDLSNVDSETTKNLLASLLFTRFWRTIVDSPRARKKILLMDEAWRITRMPGAERLVLDVAKRGRKYNASIIFITQEPEDIMATRAGRAVASNTATKIILHLDEAQELRKLLNLTSKDVEFIEKAETGQALILLDKIRLPVQILVTRKEYKLFTTKPEEWIE